MGSKEWIFSRAFFNRYFLPLPLSCIKSVVGSRRGGAEMGRNGKGLEGSAALSGENNDVDGGADTGRARNSIS